jgi:cell wall-associated NlpC family hydrolase
MLIRKMFSCAVVLCCALGLCSVSAFAQKADARSRQVERTARTNDQSCLEDEPVIVSLAENEDVNASEEVKPSKALITSGSANLPRFHQLISMAIDERLGAHYHWGSTGPRVFDCSGFVWSTFRAAGIDFERGSARTLWARFEPAAPAEQFKFGTLVFFSGLTHVAIVADEHGFYHASRHHGVVYAPFNDYWLSRIDGFRRVPLPAPLQRTD